MKKVSVVTNTGLIYTFDDLNQQVINYTPNNSRINVLVPGIYSENLNFDGKSGITVNLLPGVTYNGTVSNLGTNKIVTVDSVANLIDDNITSLTKSWSSNKINTQLSSKASIDDNVIADDKTWSSNKINTQLSSKASIDDNVIADDKTWSSGKISSMVTNGGPYNQIPGLLRTIGKLYYDAGGQKVKFDVLYQNSEDYYVRLQTDNDYSNYGDKIYNGEGYTLGAYVPIIGNAPGSYLLVINNSMFIRNNGNPGTDFNDLVFTDIIAKNKVYIEGLSSGYEVMLVRSYNRPELLWFYQEMPEIFDLIPLIIDIKAIPL